MGEVHLYQLDYGVGIVISEDAVENEVRRLCAADRWNFEEVGIEWPGTSFFWPQGLFCVNGSVLLSSPFGLYVTESSVDAHAGLRLREEVRSRLPQASALLCHAREPNFSRATASSWLHPAIGACGSGPLVVTTQVQRQLCSR